MGGQVFAAREKFEFSNGAIGWRPGGPMDCIGPFAKVQNCPIDDAGGLRLTCYATGYADSYFSIPACTRYKGKHVRGYLTQDNDGGCKFVVVDSSADRVPKVKSARAIRAARESERVPLICIRDTWRARRSDNGHLIRMHPDCRERMRRWVREVRDARAIIAACVDAA